MTIDQKVAVRRQMRAFRDAIPPEIRGEKSCEIAERLCASPWYEKADCIFAYAAIRSEVDLTPFCERAWADNKRLFFPKVDGKQMDFYRVTGWEQLEEGAFGVPEPELDVCPKATPEEAEHAMLLVPGVAFSEEGYRIGYGGGFYDRYLERKNGIYPVGICFGGQLTQDFVPEAHDRSVREVITEERRLEM
jgi:5-formyltetrahydrofolate cyclo-ligase